MQIPLCKRLKQLSYTVWLEFIVGILTNDKIWKHKGSQVISLVHVIVTCESNIFVKKVVSKEGFLKW